MHGQHLWSDEEYWKLDQALCANVKLLEGLDSIPRELAVRVFRIHDHAMLLFGCHFDPNDGFEIENISDGQIRERREQLQMVFDGFFQGYMPPDCKFSEPSDLIIE